ncbi:MAG: NUDIX domain-containing protein [Clostridiales bacterium]|nr:NUDIX domain-containing protein [Clostridiales bacterium]
MSRQPRQVHLYVYRQTPGGHAFAIFQRADNALWWQGICGGVEEGETLEQAARREAFEEAGIEGPWPLYRLDTESHLPAGLFDPDVQARWGKEVVVIPMTFFAMPFDGTIKLSPEHSDVRWLPYADAEKLVYFHDQKTALWELRERLSRGNLIR